LANLILEELLLILITVICIVFFKDWIIDFIKRIIEEIQTLYLLLIAPP
jgi:hypothetical protein